MSSAFAADVGGDVKMPPRQYVINLPVGLIVNGVLGMIRDYALILPHNQRRRLIPVHHRRLLLSPHRRHQLVHQFITEVIVPPIIDIVSRGPSRLTRNVICISMGLRSWRTMESLSYSLKRTSNRRNIRMLHSCRGIESISI